MKSVVICGSKRYKKEIASFAEELENLGVTVFAPNFKNALSEDKEFETEQLKRTVFKGLTQEHFDWIRKADTCFIFNKDDYCGVSVSMEMGYAAALGKPTYAFSFETQDPCRDGLIDKTVTSAEDLAGLL